MEQSILDFNKQFSFEPVIKNGEKLRPSESFVVGGMGGSHLAADLLTVYNPALDLVVHSDYGLPWLSDEKRDASLFIASSYSGSTEETLDFARVAKESGRNLICLASGGALIDFAAKESVPYIEMPSASIQPRAALGYSIISMAKAMGDGALVKGLHGLEEVLNPAALKPQGEELAQKLKNKIPIIYASSANRPVAYIWKITFNETGKIPAFSNSLPEQNHNELAGFDVISSTKELSGNMSFIFLADEEDHPRIKRRMEVETRLLEERGLPVNRIDLEKGPVFQKIFNSLLLADWTALALSGIYGTEPEAVRIIEEFKKLITK